MRISDWSSDVCSSDLSEPITWLLPVANFFSLADVFGAGFFETGLRARDTMMSGLPLDAVRTGFYHGQAIAIKAHNGSLLIGQDDHFPHHTIDQDLCSDPIIILDAHTSELQSLMRTSYAAFCL